LIFHNDMNVYREKVKDFYKNVKVNVANIAEYSKYMEEVNRVRVLGNGLYVAYHVIFFFV